MLPPTLTQLAVKQVYIVPQQQLNKKKLMATLFLTHKAVTSFFMLFVSPQ